MKKLFLSIVTALSIATPAVAVPVPVPAGPDGEVVWMFSPDTTGGEHTYFVEVMREDAEGDILIQYTDMVNNDLGYAWVDCGKDAISFDGGEWMYVDHRNIMGWHADIACGRPIK